MNSKLKKDYDNVRNVNFDECCSLRDCRVSCREIENENLLGAILSLPLQVKHLTIWHNKS